MEYEMRYLRAFIGFGILSFFGACAAEGSSDSEALGTKRSGLEGVYSVKGGHLICADSKNAGTWEVILNEEPAWEYLEAAEKVLASTPTFSESAADLPTREEFCSKMQNATNYCCINYLNPALPEPSAFSCTQRFREDAEAVSNLGSTHNVLKGGNGTKFHFASNDGSFGDEGPSVSSSGGTFRFRYPELEKSNAWTFSKVLYGKNSELEGYSLISSRVVGSITTTSANEVGQIQDAVHQDTFNEILIAMTEPPASTPWSTGYRINMENAAFRLRKVLKYGQANVITLKGCSGFVTTLDLSVPRLY